MIETPPPQIEGPHVGDSRPLVSLVGALAPLEPLGVLVTEILRLEVTLTPAFTPEPSLEARLDGVRVADAPPLVSLDGAVVTPPLARLIPRERLRVVDRPIRIRRQRLPP